MSSKTALETTFRFGAEIVRLFHSYNDTGTREKLPTNPILNGTADDPTTAWRSAATGEYRLLGNSGAIGQKNKGSAPMFSAPSITGPWKLIGDSPFPAGECPSLFHLPPLTHNASALEMIDLPTHVFKRGWDRGDYYILGTFKDGSTSADVGSWNQSSFGQQRRIDNGNFYAG